MNFLQRLRNLLFKPTSKPVEKVSAVEKIKVEEKIDKVSNFDMVVPQLFSPRLKEFGYDFDNIEHFEYGGLLWSSHHFYANKKLELIVKIEQAPYYTDYGFSIFLISTARNDIKLLCNVPHELQEKEDRFLVHICDRFFADRGVISILKGESWGAINHVRNE
ncbi:MAG TPA: hypothetical protein VMR70_02390 [Flavisolibacter sp.]|nr:hypothetical protein [Flavisolibacter sp.]